ncbi:MAG TPA: hypothetical protein VIV40_34915 [Kofleriaceae bacterium]
MPTLIIDVTPSDAAAIATIQVDNLPIAGHKVDVKDKQKVHVSVTAIGFSRYSKDIEIDGDTVLKVELAKRAHKRNRTLAVSLGMGAVGLIAWLVRRR